jgi:hypothetical protein
VRALDERMRLTFIADVCGNGDRTPALPCDALGKRLYAIGPPCRERNRSTGTGARKRRGLADARRGARHRHHLARKIEINVHSPSLLAARSRSGLCKPILVLQQRAILSSGPRVSAPAGRGAF